MKFRTWIAILIIMIFAVSCGGGGEPSGDSAADTAGPIETASADLSDSGESEPASEAGADTPPAEDGGDEPSPEDDADFVPRPDIGLCDTDRLNIRSSAGGEGEIIGVLLQNEQVRVLEQTSWTEEIDGFISPWVRIRSLDYEGWVYGGYIAMAVGDFDAIPLSDLEAPLPPAPPAPEKTYSVKSQNRPSGFDTDVSHYPEMTAHRTEMIDPLFVKAGDARLFVGEGFNYKLVSTFSEHPEKSVKIKAVNPDGTDFEFSYAYGNQDVRWMEPSDSDGMSLVLETPALLFDFAPYAFYERGEWFLRFYFDGNEKEAFHGSLEMKSHALTIAKDPRPAPQNAQPGRTMEFRQGETIYFWANLTDYDNATFIIYERDESRPDMVRRPKYGLYFSPDEYGMYSDEIVIGKDLPSGEYNIAWSGDKGHLELFPIQYRFRIVE